MPTLRVLQPPDLLGRWALRRRLVDRIEKRSGSVVGELLLVAEGADVRWREDGVLRWAGASVAVTRELVLRPSVSGWQVCFADGRLFHPWRPRTQLVHPCRADVYRGWLDVSAWSLRTLWDVTGPAKDQRILTRCVRA